MENNYIDENSFIGQGRSQKQLENNNWCAGMSAILFGVFIVAAIIYAGIKLFFS
jgi:hypothetical protein